MREMYSGFESNIDEPCELDMYADRREEKLEGGNGIGGTQSSRPGRSG